MFVVAVSISDAVKRSTPPFVEASIHAWTEISGGGKHLGIGETHPWNETLEKAESAAASPNGL
jgi:hypothetical protein